MVDDPTANVQSDFIGSGKIILKPLIDDMPIGERVRLLGGINKDISNGSLHVKLFWYDGVSLVKPKEDTSLMSKTWETETTNRICRVLRSKNLNLNNAFLIFDKRLQGIITFENFKDALTGTQPSFSLF